MGGVAGGGWGVGVGWVLRRRVSDVSGMGLGHARHEGLGRNAFLDLTT